MVEILTFPAIHIFTYKTGAGIDFAQFFLYGQSVSESSTYRHHNFNYFFKNTSFVNTHLNLMVYDQNDSVAQKISFKQSENPVGSPSEWFWFDLVEYASSWNISEGKLWPMAEFQAYGKNLAWKGKILQGSDCLKTIGLMLITCSYDGHCSIDKKTTDFCKIFYSMEPNGNFTKNFALSIKIELHATGRGIVWQTVSAHAFCGIELYQLFQYGNTSAAHDMIPTPDQSRFYLTLI